MLQMTLPCSHLHYLGVQFPEIQPPSLNITPILTDEIFFEYKIQESSDQHSPATYYNNQCSYAIKMIKRYSHFKNKDEIAAFVYQHFPLENVPNGFALGQPMNLLEIINNGIITFCQLKNKENIEAEIT